VEKNSGVEAGGPEEFVNARQFFPGAYLAYKDKAAPDLRFTRFLRVMSARRTMNEIL